MMQAGILSIQGQGMHMIGAIQRIARRLLGRDVNIAEIARRNGAIIGKDVHLMWEVVLDPAHAWHIEIGDQVTMAPRVHILCHDASTKMYLGYTRIGKVKIGSRVFLGADSIVMPGVTIGDDVIVGAGSVVTRDIPSRSVACGNPAAVTGTIDDYLARRQREFEKLPRFGTEYTLGGGVTPAMQEEMNRRMENGRGYIV